MTPPSTLPAPVRLQRLATRRPLILIGLGVVLYSTGPVFVQASAVPGPVFSFWRLWLGVPILGLATWWFRRRGGRMPDRRAARWAVLAGLAFGIHQVLFMSAIKATSVADVALMTTLSPILVALAALPLWGERPGPAFRLWTVVAMAGATIVVIAGSSGPQGSRAGMLMALANVVFFAVFFLLSKLGRDDIAVLPFLFGVMVVAAVAVSAFVAATGLPVGDVGGRDLLYTFAVAAGPGAVGHIVMTWPLRWVPANVPPVMRLAQPVIAGSLAWLFLGEAVTSAHLLGGGLTLAGVGGAMLTPAGRRFARSRQEIPG